MCMKEGDERAQHVLETQFVPLPKALCGGHSAKTMASD
jgi:hypothetical protein